MSGIRFYILDLGYMECDANLRTALTTLATKSNPNPDIQWCKMPCTAILVDHPTYGKILYDTGIHPEAMNGRWPKSVQDMTPYYRTEEQTLVNQLALCNTTIDEIRTVVLSHMHIDHAGGLYMFPHHQVIVHRKELKDALEYCFQQVDEEGHTTYLRSDVVEPVDKYTIVDGSFQLCEGVEFIALPGHVNGLLIMKLQLENTGTVIFPRDLINHSSNFGPPVRGSGFVENFQEYAASIEIIRDMAKRENAMLIFGHDEDQEPTLKHAPEYYD